MSNRTLIRPPAAGTPVTILTNANARITGRVRFEPDDDGRWVSVQQGGGWINIEIRHIAAITQTGPTRPFHMTRPAKHHHPQAPVSNHPAANRQ